MKNDEQPKEQKRNKCYCHQGKLEEIKRDLHKTEIIQFAKQAGFGVDDRKDKIVIYL